MVEFLDFKNHKPLQQIWDQSFPAIIVFTNNTSSANRRFASDLATLTTHIFSFLGVCEDRQSIRSVLRRIVTSSMLKLQYFESQLI